MHPTRAGGAVALAAAAFTLCAPRAEAEPIAVRFAPPEIEARDVCVARAPKHVLAERWNGWEGTALPDRPIPLVRRDLRLLAQMDVTRWADTIRAVNDLLLREVDSYDDIDRMLDRIDLLIAEDNLGTLREEGLVARLLEVAPTGSTKSKLMAAELLRDGIGTEADPARAEDFLRDAAFAGHPDAILQLVAQTEPGETVEALGIDPEVAVPLAFGGMLGSVDARVCDRINQIADHYQTGDVVAADPALAEEWYRLSARLGGSNGAWQAAQMHVAANRIARDPEVMVSLLEQAADAGLTYAMLELGRMYATGGLVPKDVDRAEEIYRRAADLGDETGLTRLVNLKRARSSGSREDTGEIIALLERMTGLEEPPAWVYSRLGNMLLVHEGRWAGEARAEELFHKALSLDPYQVPARSRLAQIEMRYADTEQEVADVTSRLRRVVSANGRADPMQDLQAIYRCRAATAPHPAKHEYWVEMEEFSGDKTVDLTAAEVRAQAADPDPFVVAQLQTQALNGRAASLANLLQIRGGDDALAPLVDVVGREGGQTHEARGDTALTLGDRDGAERLLRAGVAAGETGARMGLARLLEDDGIASEEERAEILSLVRPLAENGQGSAIRMIVALDEDVDADAAWRTYRDAIDRNGDFAALAFALTRLGDPGAVDDYLGRIRAVMPCYSGNALALARAMDALGRTEAVPHWIDVAVASARTGWEYVATADTLRDLDSSDAAVDRAATLYREGVERGYALAMRRLLNLGKEGRIELAEAETVDLYARMISSSPPQNIPSVLTMVGFAPEAVQAEVEKRIDRRALLQASADQGNATAQLDLARMVQEDAETADDLRRYAELLAASARQGNDAAMLRLSEAYTYGLGVERSLEMADTWLLRAAEAGNQDAIRTTRMLETAKEPIQ
ncbi:SEL1-like repeat protein [Roseivivax isoporae]|uniref:Sel1 repeat family protein n=1 Tax=Roseivivax isoporae LMG 25204 TaxID=1449351 RepID=X7F268_9RHOB|nr:SEL1-like repeat protein [Roseivivax isoporae]ETX26880.1 hypothetical protein RISW2_18770 [Roseivivax isoporae LMG 25204]